MYLQNQKPPVMSSCKMYLSVDLFVTPQVTSHQHEIAHLCTSFKLLF